MNKIIPSHYSINVITTCASQLCKFHQHDCPQVTWILLAVAKWEGCEKEMVGVAWVEHAAVAEKPCQEHLRYWMGLRHYSESVWQQASQQ